jgi:hypothetical protein
MMDRIVEKEINGGKYTFVPLASKAGGLEVFRRLHGHVFPVLSTLVGALQLEGGEVTLKVSGGMDALQQLVGVVGKLIADRDFAELVDKMLTACAYNRAALASDHWDHHLEDHDVVVAWLVWVNFLRPLAGNVTNLQGLVARLGDKFPALKTSIPSSPAS